MGPGYNSNNGSGVQGLQCPIGLVEQNWLEMSLNGEFPEHIPHCSKAGLASSPTIMPSSHTTQSHYTVSRDNDITSYFQYKQFLNRHLC